MTTWQTYHPSLIKFEPLVDPGNWNPKYVRPSKISETLNLYQGTLTVLTTGTAWRQQLRERKLSYVWMDYEGNTSHLFHSTSVWGQWSIVNRDTKFLIKFTINYKQVWGAKAESNGKTLHLNPNRSGALQFGYTIEFKGRYPELLDFRVEWTSLDDWDEDWGMTILTCLEKFDSC